MIAHKKNRYEKWRSHRIRYALIGMILMGVIWFAILEILTIRDIQKQKELSVASQMLVEVSLKTHDLLYVENIASSDDINPIYQIEAILSEDDLIEYSSQIIYSLKEINDIPSEKSENSERACIVNINTESTEEIYQIFSVLSSRLFKAQTDISHRIKRLFILNALGVLGFLLCVAYFIKRQILKPVHNLTRQLQDHTENLTYLTFRSEGKNEITTLVDEYNTIRRKNQVIEEMNHKLNAHDHFEDILDFIYEQYKPFIPYNRIGIAVLSPDKERITALSARSDRDVLLNKNYELPLKSTSLQSIIDSGEPRVINDLEAYYEMHYKSESTALVLREGMKSSVTFPLVVQDWCVGVVFFSSTQKNIYEQGHIQFLKTVASALSSAFDRSHLNDQLLVATIQGFARLVESKDSGTGNHIERMQKYAVVLTELLKVECVFPQIIDDKYIRQIKDFSPLHDIGKVAVPDRILLKPSRLDGDEFEAIKQHAVVGGDILEEMDSQIGELHRGRYRVGVEIARHHHEKYDGTGYPHKLSGKDIPLSARIVAIADVFDALTSSRSYKEAYSIEKAKAILNEGKGSHFDPDILDVFMKYWNQFETLAINFRIENDLNRSMIS